MRRTPIVALATVFFLTGATPPDWNGSMGVQGLTWMGGVWLEGGKGGWTEERWSPPRGGVMLGTNLSGRGSTATGFEFLRIAADDRGRVTYWASPGVKNAVPFRLTAASPTKALFENPQHDFPTRIEYRRKGDEMIAAISGPGGANPMTWTFKRAPEQ